MYSACTPAVQRLCTSRTTPVLLLYRRLCIHCNIAVQMEQEAEDSKADSRRLRSELAQMEEDASDAERRHKRELADLRDELEAEKIEAAAAIGINGVLSVCH